METLNVLHLENSETDALLVRKSLERGGLKCNIRVVHTLNEYNKALVDEPVDAVLADNQIEGISPLMVLEAARAQRQEMPLIYVSGSMDESVAIKALQAGATGFVKKTQLERLSPLLRSSVLATHHAEEILPNLGEGAMRILLTAACDLARAHSLHEILYLAKRTARRITGSDGSTVILREGDRVFYADEDAIGPLWKGRHFPLANDIGGWSMTQQKATIVPDVTKDDRISIEMYRPTFVRSLLVVPVGKDVPHAAIGSYWSAARKHLPTTEELRLLELLAESVAAAMENVTQLIERNRRISDTTSQILELNIEFKNLTQAISHDLHVPLHSMRSLIALVEEEHGTSLPGEVRRYFGQIRTTGDTVMRRVQHLMDLAKIACVDLSFQEVNLSELVEQAVQDLSTAEPGRRTNFSVEPGLKVRGDITLLRNALNHLLANAWKFTTGKDVMRIDFKAIPTGNGHQHFVLRDNGMGFTAQDAEQIFRPFSRLQSDLPGDGIGLAIVRRIFARHGGRVWAEGLTELGAAFHFTLPIVPQQVQVSERSILGTQ